ncbi:MAG: PAS domain-containing protein, partial [Adhaeribacter sp.]
RLLQFAHPEERQTLEEAISRSRQQARADSLSLRIIRTDGEVRFLYWQFESLADARGRVDRIRGTVRDITEQKRTDLILDAINEVCFELNDTYHFIYANRKAYSSWKKSPEQVLGQPIWEIFPQDRDTQLFEVISQVAATRSQVIREIYYPAIKGWIMANVYPSPAGLIVLYFEVTEQVVARRRLMEQQAQYQALVENIPDLVTRWDRHLKLVYANSAFWDQTGLPLQLGKALQNLGLHQEVSLVWQEKLNQVFITGQTMSHYYAFPSPRGVVYFFAQVVPERGADGSVQTVLAMAHDITDLKEAEAEVIKGKAILQSVLDASPNGIVLARAVRNEEQDIIDFEYVYTNQGFTNILGREAADLRYLTQNPRARETGIAAKLQKVVETGRLLDEEICYRHEGGHKWFRLIAVKVDDGVVANFADISLRKGQEEAIVKHLSILQQSEHLTRMGSWEYDVATGAFLWSEGMYRLFGLPPGTPVNPEIYRDYVQEKDRLQAERLIHTLRQEQQPFEGSLQVKVRGRRKTFRIKSVVVPGQQGLPAKVLGVDLDVTEVQRLEQENLAMKLRAQKKLILAILEAQETERKRIAEALHNGVGQLLYAARLHLSHLSRDPETSAAARQQVDQLLDEAITETRRLSHELVPAVLEDLGLAAALADIGRKYSGQQLELVCRISDLRRPLAKHLELALFRIAQELANNIVKHAGATKASIQIRQQDRYLALLAEDNGSGFASEAGQDPAAGMGLKAIRDRVNLLNGTMTIDSRPGQGTLISIYLPLTASG